MDDPAYQANHNCGVSHSGKAFENAEAGVCS